MRRRAFISLLGGAAASPILWPLAARGQQPALPVIGFLNARSPGDTAHLLPMFHRGLAESGFVDGRNVLVEFYWAEGRYERLPALAAEIARRPVDVIVAAGGEPAALAAKAATSTIPIAFVIGGDPVKTGLVASYSRPGGNATGVNILTRSLEAKRIGLLRELVPQASTIGLLINPGMPAGDSYLADAQDAARGAGLQLMILRASTDQEIDAAFETIARQRVSALAIGADPFFDTRRTKLLALAAQYAVPTIYQFREYATSGGLMSYGADVPDLYRQIAVYAGRILKGAKPADLPVLQPTKFEFVINLKTAKALGLSFPPGLLAIADEVIE
jgi:putative ABC transport system substrate-binding protein